MGRPRIKINPKRGQRLKQLCISENITFKSLADSIPISAQSISEIVNGKASLTEQVARRVVELFPKYRFEWLMGFDDFKTEAEARLLPAAQRLLQDEQRRDNLTNGIVSLGGSCGYLFKPEGKNVVIMTDDGKVLARTSIEMFMQFEYAVQSFCAFTLNQIITHCEEAKNNG